MKATTKTKTFRIGQKVRVPNGERARIMARRTEYMGRGTYGDVFLVEMVEGEDDDYFPAKQLTAGWK
jgi:hypothetical protein